MRPRLAPTLVLAALLGLSGCDLIPDYFGTTDEGPPLPGERISIMAFSRSLEVDPALSAVEVRLPNPYDNPDWQQAGGVAHHAMYHLELGDQPNVAWRADIGDGSGDDRQILAQPIIAGGRIYTMDARAQISAFDRQSGNRAWSVDLEVEGEDDGYFGGGIAHEDGRLFVTTGFGGIYALNASNGDVIWSEMVTGPIRSAPTVSAGRVFAVTLENQTYALAAEDGRRLWEHTGLEETASLLGSSSPAVSGSTVIVPYSSGELFAIRVENGRVLWSDTLSSISRVDPIADLGQIRALPVIDRGIVLAISNSGTMTAVDLRRGARVWDANLGGVEMPWAAGEYVYVLTNEAQLVCLSRRNGRIRWVQLLPQFEDAEDLEDPIQWFGPVLAGDRLIIVGSHEVALTLSPYSGEKLGYLSLPASPAVAPVVAGRTLYIVTNDGDLIALR